MKCLEKDGNLRYQPASEIRTDLQWLKRDTETGKISPIKTVETLPTRAWWLRKAAISGAVVGVIAVLVAAPTGSDLSARDSSPFRVFSGR